MSLGEIKRRTYLSIKQGKVERTENGEKSYYQYVEGRLSTVYKKEREFNGKRVFQWYLEMTDDSGELYCITFPYNSGTFKSIVLSLASDGSLSPESIVRIEPYEKQGFTKVVVWSEGVRLDWVSRELPPVETINVGGKQYKDESKRMQFIERHLANVLSRLSGYGAENK